MSEAKNSFEYGIQDAEDLLGHFDTINTNPPPEKAEVLKRAGLVMALTAWESLPGLTGQVWRRTAAIRMKSRCAR